MIEACAGSTITFNVTGTIPLSSGQIKIDKDLTIQGPGADVLIVQNTAARSTTSRIFNFDSGVTATIAGLTISGGDIYAQSSSDNGGGIYNAGNLTVTGSIITNNQALSPGGFVGLTLGGGITNVTGATLIVVNSTISNNNVFGIGGGIANFGTLNIDRSTISANVADYDGGGIYTAGAVNITNSTISSNGTGLFGRGGGGIYQNAGTVMLTNSTVSGNVQHLLTRRRGLYRRRHDHFDKYDHHKQCRQDKCNLFHVVRVPAAAFTRVRQHGEQP